MRTLLAAIACVAMLTGLASDVQAHGDEKHDETSAPVSAATVAASADMPPEQPEPATHDEVSDTVGVSNVLKNLHPATVHFPIALLLVAALTQAAALARGSASLDNAARVMAVAGGVGATLAAVFGWIHTGIWTGGDATMQLHRWIGSALGLAGPAIAWLALRPQAGRKTYLTLLFAAALAVIVQGYLGAELSHGAGHLWQ